MPSIPPEVLLEIELAGRIVLAFILGGVIGYERELIRRPAGFRTHMLVCAGSAAFTIASAFAFPTQGTVRDPTRIAAQIVTGVGFLGAGTIWRAGTSVRGLTTAASIWLVAAVGVLAGSGLYLLAIFSTGLAFFVLYFLKAPRRRVRLGEPSIVPENRDEADEEGE
jgi:putative Mg2+ transporter-C (MgtC) family protein